MKRNGTRGVTLSDDGREIKKMREFMFLISLTLCMIFLQESRAHTGTYYWIEYMVNASSHKPGACT